MLRALGLAGPLALALVAAAARADEPILLGPYVPSPQSVVTRMLQVAGVGPDDFVIDLGSGDGRIPITAAKEFGARGLGVDIDAALVAQSIANAKQAGVSGRVEFRTQDVFATDISKATVVTIYLLPKAIDLLSDKLLNELKPGTRVVTHDYDLKDWIMVRYEQMDLPEKVAISGTSKTYVMLFVIPAQVAGKWTASAPQTVSRKTFALELSQRAQQVWGQAWLDGVRVPVEQGEMVGEELRFALEPAAGRELAFKGKVKDGKIEGTVSGAVTGAWSASQEKR